jgi:hypothetical protein
VARSVEEGDLPPVVLDLVGADVLGDPACLGLDDRGLADRVEERRLAVVDVAHDRDHRRARLQRLLRVVVGLRLLVLLARVLDRDLTLELGGDQLDGLVRQRLGDGDHLPQSHHDLDDLGDRLSERLRELLDSDARLDGDRACRLDDLTWLLRPRVLAIARLARVGARPRRLRVDDDTALPAPCLRLTRPDRPIWFVSALISHGQGAV